MNREEFRSVIGRFVSGVSIVTTHHDGVNWGMTLSALCSVSLEPPTVLVCVHRQAPTGEAATAAGHFAVNILSSDQGGLARAFAMPAEDKFAGVDIQPSSAGDPLLLGAVAHLECEVREEVLAGTHRILIAEVASAATSDVDPLTYFRGDFGRFELTAESEAYRRLTSMVLEQVLPADAPLDPVAIAERLDTSVPAVVYALTRLVGDGLVARDPDVGYRLVAFDPGYAMECYEAKRALDHAVAQRAVGRTRSQRIARLRSLCDRANGYAVDGSVVDIPGYRAAVAAFQEAFVDLADNRALSSLCRTLRIPELVTVPQQAVNHRAAAIAANRDAIVSGLEDGDLSAMVRALDDQADLHIELALDLLTNRVASV